MEINTITGKIRINKKINEFIYLDSNIFLILT